MHYTIVVRFKISAKIATLVHLQIWFELINLQQNPHHSEQLKYFFPVEHIYLSFYRRLILSFHHHEESNDDNVVRQTMQVWLQRLYQSSDTEFGRF